MEGASDGGMNGAGSLLLGLMNVKEIIENNLKLVINSSVHKNETWGNENSK